MNRFVKYAPAALLGLLPVTLSAQSGFDMAAMAKWSDVEVVRYHIEGVFEGKTNIAHGVDEGQAMIKDRLVIDLVWNTKKSALVGTPRLQNSPSSVSVLKLEDNCPPPVPKGAYDRFEASAVVPDGGERVVLKGQRAYPDVYMGPGCGGGPGNIIKAMREPQVEYLALPSPTLLALPPPTSGNILISKDRQSFTIKGDWTWTYTPSTER